MHIFSQNALLLGLIYGAFVILFNWVLVLYAVWRKMKIEEVKFLNGEKALLRTEVKGVKFILGWLPFGTSMKILGMGPLEEEELNKIPKEDLPHAFFNQPLQARFTFRLLIPLIYAFMALATFAFGVDLASFKTFWEALSSFYFSLGGFDQFALAASEFAKNHSEILLVLLFLNMVAAIQMLFNEFLTQLFLNSQKSSGVLRGVATTLLFLTSGWMLYKLLGFAVVYYGAILLFFLMLNLLAVILLVNVVLFFVMLPLFRMVLPAPRVAKGN